MITQYGCWRQHVPNSPMIKDAAFFISQGGLRDEWGKHWQPIHDCATIGDARRKFAASYGAKLSHIYDGEV